jgi:hypothetical protein
MLETKHTRGAIANTIDRLKARKKLKHVNAVEKSHIHDLSKQIEHPIYNNNFTKNPKIIMQN